MQITNDDVRHLALLSRLAFDEDEIEQMRENLVDMIHYVDKVNATPCDLQAREHILSLHNVFREDVVQESLSNEEALQNAPESEEMYFKVPQVMEDE